MDLGDCRDNSMSHPHAVDLLSLRPWRLTCFFDYFLTRPQTYSLMYLEPRERVWRLQNVVAPLKEANSTPQLNLSWISRATSQWGEARRKGTKGRGKGNGRRTSPKQNYFSTRPWLTLNVAGNVHHIRTRRRLYSTSRPSKHAGCDFHTDDRLPSSSWRRSHIVPDAALLGLIRPTTSRRQLCSIDDWTSQHLPLHAAAVATRHMGPNERTTSATKLNELRATCYELRRDVRSVCGINDLCYPLGVASRSALNLHVRLNSICFVTCQFVNFHLLSVKLPITWTLSNDAYIVK